MGYGTNGLTFNGLREANIERLPTFKNSKGEPAHSKDDGSDWSISDWVEAVTGELGEFANLHKKFRRGDISKEQFDKEGAKELADIQTYLDLLAFRCGVNLGQATMDKFNEVSDRINSYVRLSADGMFYDYEVYNKTCYAHYVEDMGTNYKSFEEFMQETPRFRHVYRHLIPNH